MAEHENNVESLWRALGIFMFWGYIAVKWVGTAFAAWSWWWVLLPIVPWLALLVAHAGL